MNNPDIQMLLHHPLHLQAPNDPPSYDWYLHAEGNTPPYRQHIHHISLSILPDKLYIS